MKEIYIGKCPKCDDKLLYEFDLEFQQNMVINDINITCPDCNSLLSWTCLPIYNKKLIQSHHIGYQF